jgi:anti-sigma regulatory factor (Ser/Thr protein kinase)
LEIEPFVATLEPDPMRLRELRAWIVGWLANAGIYASVRDEIALATHEAAASALESSPSTILVKAAIEQQAITVVVESDGAWVAPDADEGGHRMALLRKVMSEVEFDPGRSSSTLRLTRAL